MPKITAPSNIPTIKNQMIKIDKFLGVDFTSSVLNVAVLRSPDAVNMIPDLDGFPVKRHGWDIINTLDGAINGAHKIITNDINKVLIHAGTKLYDGTDVIYSSMANSKSQSVQFDNKLYIADGTKLLVYGEFTDNDITSWQIKAADTIGTVPTITTGRSPSGGGQSYNPPNLLSNKVTEDFLSDGTSKNYQLSYTDLPENGSFEIKTKNASGEWAVMQSGYTVNRTTGIVAFSTAPGVPAVTGEDNVRITYQKNQPEDIINNCNIAMLYGVNGQPDRLWLSGNSNKSNYCYYSAFRDPLYFGDVWYTIAGGESAPITGFSLLQNRLVIHKDGEEHQRNAYVLSSSLDEDGDAQFPIINILQGEGALGCFDSIGTEPMFLTRRGVYAITSSDVTGEKYAQNRSYYINGKLLHKSLNAATACTWGKFYVLAVDGEMYLLDSEQKSYEKNSPYSTYQYEAYYCNNIPAKIIWTKDEILYFGDTNGNVYAFKTGNTSDAFKDGDTNVTAYWSTPLMSLNNYGYYKTVIGAWIICQPYARSGAEIYFATDREYKTFASSFNIDIFDWNNIDFNRFTFNTMDRPSIQYIRKKAKKIKLFQLICENCKAEPYGIAAVQIEFRTNGKVK